MTLQFEFHAYKGDEDGVIAERAEITQHAKISDSSARSYAGRLAKRIKGPVDLARAGGAPWEERYLTTASPSEHHTAGYRFERLT